MTLFLHISHLRVHSCGLSNCLIKLLWQDYRIGSLAKRTYINENRHENGISNYIWQNDSAEILIFSRIVF